MAISHPEPSTASSWKEIGHLLYHRDDGTLIIPKTNTRYELQLAESNNAAVFPHRKDGAHQPDHTPRTLISRSDPETTLPPSTRTPLPPMILTSRPPALAHVCRDSRAFAQERYKAAYGSRKTASTSSELEAESRRGLEWVSRSTIGVLHACESNPTLMGLEGRLVLVHDPAYLYPISAEAKEQFAQILSGVQDSQIMMCMGHEAAVWIPYRAAKTFKLPWGWALGTGRNSSQFVNIRDMAVLQEIIRELNGLVWVGAEDVCGITRLRDLVENAHKREEFCALSLERFKAFWNALNTLTDTNGEVRLKGRMPRIGTVLQFFIMDEPWLGPGV
ncbi:hypothetical protein QBC45DRAFT_453582 [Copromyces sp. CBS 386.78]|nr:hypothetical protein QBC45DRAFT_453582 [Copromyces sp. CBS 386.78]